MLPGLMKPVGRVNDHQKKHPANAERFCMGKYHCAFQQHSETPCINMAKPSFSGPGFRPCCQSGRGTDKTGGHQDPKAGVLLCLHVGDGVTGDRKKTCPESYDQLIDVPLLSGTESCYK
jgi:hypothetical protein